MIYFPFMNGTNLGNWMFQYAAALSLGQPVKGFLECPYVKSKVLGYQDIFGGVELVGSLPKDVREYEQPYFGYSPFPERLHSGDWLIRGYYQSEKFFNKPLVRRMFAPSDARVDYLHGKYGQWLDREEVTGISVRRGDYFKQLYNHPFVGTQYLIQAVRQFPGCDSFIVCSDDLDWCRMFFVRKFPQKHFLFVENESVLDQLYIHTLCRHNIISNSSFSWWGAWLNANPQKRVIAPSHWFGFAKKHDTRDLYWDGMEFINNSYGLVEWTMAYWQFARRQFAECRSKIMYYLGINADEVQ